MEDGYLKFGVKKLVARPLDEPDSYGYEDEYDARLSPGLAFAGHLVSISGSIDLGEEYPDSSHLAGSCGRS